MSLPMWVPWVLALSLALPVVLRRASGPSSRAGLVVMASPALVMTLVAASLSLDRARVSQDELDTAAGIAAGALDGSLGPVDSDRVAGLVADELGRDVVVERSDLTVLDELNAGYSIQVRLSHEAAEPVACLDVTLEVLDGQAPDLRLADVTARSGACG